MESITYITQNDLTLQNILEIAQEYHYQTALFVEGHEQLSIRFGKDPSEWWVWLKILESQMLFDDDAEYELLAEIAPKSIFVIEYHTNTLATLADFLKTILKRFGGWVECRGIKSAYTIENIDLIVAGCP